jgi:flagellar basal body-associated protein FliL
LKKILKNNNLNKRSSKMQKKLILIIMVLVAGLSAAVVAVNTAYAAEKAKNGKAQTVCPVLGGEIDKQLYVDIRAPAYTFAARDARKNS